MLYAASRFEDAIAKLTEAVSILEQMGDPWEANTASWHIAFCQYRLGRLDEAVVTARRVRQAALEIGDDQAAAISLGGVVEGLGRPDPGRVDRPGVEGGRRRRARLGRGPPGRGGTVLAGSGSFAAAIEVLELAARRAASGVRQEYVAPVRPWLVTALRREAERTPPWEPGRRSALLRRARCESRRALRISSRYRNNLPHALRERALVAAMQGRPGRASRLLDRSLHEAERQGARHEYAQTLAARGELGRSLGWEGAEQQAEAGRRALEEMGAARDGVGASRIAEQEQPTLALLDRFTAVVDAGRRIVSALSREEVLAAVREASVSVLRAEDCTVVELVGKDGWGCRTTPAASRAWRWSSGRWPRADRWCSKGRSASIPPRRRPSRRHGRRSAHRLPCVATPLPASTPATSTSVACSATRSEAWPDSFPRWPVPLSKALRASPR